MRNRITLVLAVLLSSYSLVTAGVNRKQAAYVGGTFAEFKDTKSATVGNLVTVDDKLLMFQYMDHSRQVKSIVIPYDQIIALEYGQKTRRRIAESIATAVLVNPVGLTLLFAKQRKHYFTIAFKGRDGESQVAVFELGKNIVRVTLAIVKARSGKEIQYQDDDARKASKGA